jgi:uncharacterized protein (TIGR00297 family)
VPPTNFGLELLNHSQPAARILPALAATSIFGLLGYFSRGVTGLGAVAGTVVAFLIYVGLGLGGFVTLFSVFAITWLATRIGYSRKRYLGLAENRRGRNARQVLANVAAPAGFALIAIWNGPLFACGAVAALAEAAADTASSEIGEVASRRAWLITSFKPVSPGTDGAISLPGTFAGLFAGTIVALVAVRAHVVSWQIAWIPAVAGFLGTIVDSLLGATLERSHQLDNNGVNLLSTISAGLIAVVLLMV